MMDKGAACWVTSKNLLFVDTSTNTVPSRRCIVFNFNSKVISFSKGSIYTSQVGHLIAFFGLKAVYCCEICHTVDIVTDVSYRFMLKLKVSIDKTDAAEL